MYLSVQEVARKWDISDRRVRALCENGQIPGAIKVGKSWNIPEDAKKPTDPRRNIDYLKEIEVKKAELDSRRPLTQGELERLNEEFLVEYTYNSNAIEGNTLTLRETDMVLRGITIDKKPLKDHLEAIGHKDAFNYMVKLVQEKANLTEDTIKQLHSLVLANKPEQYIEVKGNHPPQVMFKPIEKEVLGLDLKTEFNVYDKDKNIVDKKEIYLERDFGFHSDGTYRLLSILGIVLKVLDKGGVIVIDEIDSKLNFLIVDYILKSFNSINKNINNAQLITTAHNVLLMDDDLRRDQIYFASKNKYGATEFYSLADFNDVRKTDLFSKKYLAGFYSAIPNIRRV